MGRVNRQPAGQPTGGQFAPNAKANAGVSLGFRDDSVHPDNLVVEGMLDLARERLDDPGWREAFPEDIRSRWLHHVSLDRYMRDHFGPAMQAMDEGREDDATWYFNQLSAINDNETRWVEEGYTPPPGATRVRHDSGAGTVTGVNYQQGRDIHETANLLKMSLEQARDAGYLVDGDFQVSVAGDNEVSGSIKVTYDPDKTLLYRANGRDSVDYSEYGREVYHRVSELTWSFVHADEWESGGHRVYPYIELDMEPTDFRPGEMEALQDRWVRENQG